MFRCLIMGIKGETAIDLTDPEDFRMMAILRNTEVQPTLTKQQHLRFAPTRFLLRGTVAFHLVQRLTRFCKRKRKKNKFKENYSLLSFVKRSPFGFDERAWLLGEILHLLKGWCGAYQSINISTPWEQGSHHHNRVCLDSFSQTF